MRRGPIREFGHSYTTYTNNVLVYVALPKLSIVSFLKD